MLTKNHSCEVASMHISIAGYNLYCLFIFTIDYNMNFTLSQLPTKRALKVWAIDLSITFYELICEVNEVNFNILFLSDKKDT